jgi:phosphoglycolate phosphatase
MNSDRNSKTYLAFDVDGTIYDSTEIIVDAFRDGISRFIEEKKREDVPLPGYDEIVNVLGIPVDEIFRTLFPMLEEGEADILNDRCTESLVSMIKRGGGRIFENVYSTMEALYHDGYVLLAASNGRREYIEAILTTHGLMKFFTGPMVFINGEIEDKSGIVSRYRENVSGEHLMIMIGDRFTDRKAASDNNIPFIGCAFGHAGDDEIAGSRWIVREFNQVPGAIKEVEESRK